MCLPEGLRTCPSRPEGRQLLCPRGAPSRAPRPCEASPRPARTPRPHRCRSAHRRCAPGFLPVLRDSSRAGPSRPGWPPHASPHASLPSTGPFGGGPRPKPGAASWRVAAEWGPSGCPPPVSAAAPEGRARPAELAPVPPRFRAIGALGAWRTQTRAPSARGGRRRTPCSPRGSPAGAATGPQVAHFAVTVHCSRGAWQPRLGCPRLHDGAGLRAECGRGPRGGWCRNSEDGPRARRPGPRSSLLCAARRSLASQQRDHVKQESPSPGPWVVLVPGLFGTGPHGRR